MSKINGVNPSAALPPISAPSVAKAPVVKPGTQQEDTVEISPQARLASKLADVPPVRSELIARVKAEIQAGTYETSEKLDMAIDRLMDEQGS
jgi:negative regulator of flagellin synthesis FlgM